MVQRGENGGVVRSVYVLVDHTSWDHGANERFERYITEKL